MRTTSETSKTSHLRQKLENEKQYRSAVSTLFELLSRLRSEKTSAWFRKQNSVSFWKLEENCSQQGGKSCMILNYEGTKREQYVKRGAHKDVKEVDMKLVEGALMKMKLHQKEVSLSETEEAELRKNVEMLLTQYSNVTEKTKKKISFKSILSSKAKTKTYSFSVMGVSFECEYSVLSDLEFNTFEEIRDYLMESIIELSEKTEAEEAEKQEETAVVQLKLKGKLIRYTYEIQIEIAATGNQIVLQAKTIKPVAGKYVYEYGFDRLVFLINQLLITKN